MKNVFGYILSFAAFAWASAHAEESTALHWSYQLAQPAQTARVGDTLELLIKADIDPHWLVYSSDFKSDIGPQPTAFEFSGSTGIELIGEIRSVEPKRKTDRTWEIEVGYFEKQAEFRQKVRILRPDFVVRGTIGGQLCNEQDGTCTLFTQPIAFTNESISKRK